MTECRALAAETEALMGFTMELGADAWLRPTPCPPLNVRQLLAHVLLEQERLLPVDELAQPFSSCARRALAVAVQRLSQEDRCAGPTSPRCG